MATHEIENIDAYCRQISHFIKIAKEKKPEKKAENYYGLTALLGILLFLYVVSLFLSSQITSKAIICQDSVDFRDKAESFAKEEEIAKSQIFYFTNGLEARQKALELKVLGMDTTVFSNEFDLSDIVRKQYFD